MPNGPPPSPSARPPPGTAPSAFPSRPLSCTVMACVGELEAASRRSRPETCLTPGQGRTCSLPLMLLVVLHYQKAVALGIIPV